MSNRYNIYINTPYLSRCEAIGRYIAETGDTVRGAAKVFGVSKSTVHKDITINLKNENYSLYCRVADVLKLNKEQRHIRGGLATRDKYLHMSKAQNTPETQSGAGRA